MSDPTKKKPTCTHQVSPGNYELPRACGNPSKGKNRKGEERCGVHGDAAKDRVYAKRKADIDAREARAAAWKVASFRNALQGISEDAGQEIFTALKVRADQLLGFVNQYGRPDDVQKLQLVRYTIAQLQDVVDAKAKS